MNGPIQTPVAAFETFETLTTWKQVANNCRSNYFRRIFLKGMLSSFDDFGLAAAVNQGDLA